jgi:hypothetical protein
LLCRKAEDDASLHLRPDRVRVDDLATVDDADDAVDAKRPGCLQRDLRDLADEAAEPRQKGDSAAPAGRQRRAPAGRPRGAVEHAALARRFREQRPAIVVGVAPSGVRQLVDEALDEERVL